MRNQDRDVNLHLGTRLRRRRRILGLTQKDVADKIGIRFQQIQKYESASNQMSAEKIWQLSVVLGVPVSYFYDGIQDNSVKMEATPNNIEAALLLEAFKGLAEAPRMRVLELVKAMKEAQQA